MVSNSFKDNVKGTIWICRDCDFRFGAPLFDIDVEKGRCPYCGSININIFKYE